MTLGKKTLIVAIVSFLGLWGCAKGPANNGAAAEHIKSLEAKIGKLESDFRVVATARDQARSQLTTAEEQRNQLQQEVAKVQQEVAKVQKERDALRVQVTTRTGERDALQVQYEQFRKAIKEAIGQADAAASPVNPQPVTAAGAATLPGKS